MTPAEEPPRLAVLVHEVRSPVAALSAVAETFADEDLDKPARLDLARLAIAACRGIERVVIDATVASIHLEQVDVGALVHQVAAAASLVGTDVETEIALELPRISADPLRLRQALDNLIANALTHAGPDPTVVVRATSSVASVHLSVQDFGVGVPVAEHERIFEEGIQLDPRRTGSGLGLAIARAIAESHGGELTLRSTPGEGATFTIVLPVN
ncbi:MAG: sensor histidine kinase [Gaiellaceae bacterium]